MDQTSLDHIKGVVEAILFVNEKPVMFEQLKDVLEGISNDDIRTAIAQLKQDYEQRNSGISLIEIAEGYQMLSNSLYASSIRTFYKTRHKEKLSKPSLETLAIIAYKQPVTRGDIEIVRGVNSDGVMVHLLSKELIKAVGRKEIAGRPYLYGTTKQFLEYFGLKSLTDLPKLESIQALSEMMNKAGAAEESVATIASTNRLPEVEAENATPDVNNLKEAMQEVEQRETEPIVIENESAQE